MELSFTAPPQQPAAFYSQLFGVAVYELRTGTQQAQLVMNSLLPCRVQWWPCSTRLSVGNVCRHAGAGDAGMSCSVAVHETATWQPVGPACDGQVAAALCLPVAADYHPDHPLCRSLSCDGEWAPDWRRYLQKAHLFGAPNRAGYRVHSGRFTIVDAIQGSVLAVITSQVETAFLKGFGWHPSGEGVVHVAEDWALGSEDELQLQAAGLLVGTVPEPYTASLGSGDHPLRVHPTGYALSPDGQYQCAADRDKGGHAIFSCTAQGPRYRFELMSRVGGSAGYQVLSWLPVPGIPARLVMQIGGMLVLVAPTGRFLGELVKCMNPAGCSPSGGCIIGKDQYGANGRMCIRLPSGEQVRMQEAACCWMPTGAALLQAGCVQQHKGPFTILHYDREGEDPGFVGLAKQKKRL